MSTMAWYPLPQSGSALSAGDEFFENQSAGWSLWSFGSSDDHTNTTPRVYPVKQESGEDGAARSEEESVQTPMEPQPCTALQTDDIFLSQFSDEEMRRMDAISFETLDMFPGSMHRLLSYEDMLSGVLTGVVSSEGQDQDAARLDRDGVDAMDTCGFPLFSHDLQQDAAEPNGEGITLAETLSMDEAGMGTVKRSRVSFADDEGAGGFEALVLEELEDVVFQLTKKTRICFRDAFFRMAETSSKARCGGGGASGAASEVGSGSGGQSVRQEGCPERETNAIDRTVADLTMRPPCPAPLQVHGSCCAGGSGAAAAHPTASWTTRA